MRNFVKCWWYKEDFLDNFDPDEAIYISDFDMFDDYIYETYKDFEVIEIEWNHGSVYRHYFIDNTLRRQPWT
jgi:hypothetical protein